MASFKLTLITTITLSFYSIDVLAQSNGSINRCTSNNDCISSTFCCSTSKCVYPDVCILGLKVYNDYCDYNFECLTTCCTSNRCSHFNNCHSKCQNNFQCRGTSSCCSQNSCTDAVICKGNKIQGDYCDYNSECISQVCSDHQCSDPAQSNFMSNIIIMSFVALILLFMIAYCIYYNYGSDSRRNSLSKSMQKSRSGSLESRQKFLEKDSGRQSTRSGSPHQFIGQSNAKAKKLNFKKLVKDGVVSTQKDQRYMATPIQEQPDEFNTYDSQGHLLHSSLSSHMIGNLASREHSQFIRHSLLDDRPNHSANQSLEFSTSPDPKLKFLTSKVDYKKGAWTTKNSLFRHKSEKFAEEFDSYVKSNNSSSGRVNLFRSISPGRRQNVVMENEEFSDSDTNNRDDEEEEKLQEFDKPLEEIKKEEPGYHFTLTHLKQNREE